MNFIIGGIAPGCQLFLRDCLSGRRQFTGLFTNPSPGRPIPDLTSTLPATAVYSSNPKNPLTFIDIYS